MNESRSHLAVLGLVVAVLVAVFTVGYNTPIRLGLDLQGGLEIVLKATPQGNDELTTEELEQSVKIIRERVDGLGVSEPEIRTQGKDQIAIELPGLQNPDAAVEVVGSTAQLRFYDFSERLIGSKAYRNSWDLLSRNKARTDKEIAAHEKALAKAEADVEEAKGAAEKKRAKKRLDDLAAQEVQLYLFNGDREQVAGPADNEELLLEEFDGKLPKKHEILKVAPGEVMVHGAPDALPVAVHESGRFNKETGVFILLEDKAGLTGDLIRSGTPETSGGGWVTSILFTDKGGDQFGKITGEIARNGALAGNQQSFAIVLDDEIMSAPTIDYTQYPNGIKGNQAQITGLDDRQEAENLALVLNTGSLPVEFEVISKTQVSATLGGESLEKGLLAGAAGLVIVMIYLILFYRFLGLIANIALLAYAFIFYGLIVGIPIVMTLPGIAGMVLTIGVAADANIIIFERIREEYRAGRTVRASIKAGYSKGLHTILDANGVTLIAAFVLFVIGSGSVRGFALLLGVGTLLSMFTAVAATYAMLGLLGRSRIMRYPWVIGGSRQERRFHFTWMKYRKVMYGITIGAIGISILLVATMRLNLGVDFKSGTKYDVTLEQKVGQEDVRAVLVSVDSKYEKAQIQETKEAGGEGESGNAAKGGSAFAIRVESSAKANDTQSAEEANAALQAREREVEKALDDKYGIATAEDGDQAFSVQTIGPSFGRQIVESAIVAIIVSLILEVLYIAMRFEPKYSIPVIVALAHDMLVAAGAYALTNREFNSATVAALLTILGYSLYDTIIVFDRIRENTGILRKSSFARIVDVSINEVLTRSINTTLVVLLPISALFFFGGETLKDFAYALLVGIFAGTYSSIVIAAPILCKLKEREPAWQRRMDGAVRPSRRTAVAAATANGSVTPTGELAGNGSGGTSATTAAADTADDPAATDSSGMTAQQRRDKRSRAQRKK